MQRYPATGVGGGVGNVAPGGTTSRDTAKADSPFQSSNYSLNARRPLLQVTPYKLTCDREPLNVRLGPPDYYPQTPNCPEETLSKEYVLHGYKETIDGLEEAREITLSQLGSFTKPIVVKCKEAIRKRLRAINESRAQKRKAGQVYGVPLCGSLLAKPCVFPEQQPCSEDFRKKWIEGLSQQHKRLRLLAEHVPHGYRRRGLFEVLIRHNVPLLRASWFMKVTCLNQVRPFAASVSSGAADQYSRSEFWTREVTDYLLILLEEFFPKDGSFPTQGKDQMPQGVLAGSLQHKGDLSSTLVDAEEPSLHSKWWYMVRILHWHHAEGLIIPSLLIEWVFRQLQDRDSLEALQLLLPIIFGVIETLALSQSYVRNLVVMALRYIPEAIPSGPDLVENSLRAYIVSALVEMLQYLILAVPDTFVALDCFPLPPRVLSEPVNGRNFILKASENAKRVQYGLGDSGTMDPVGRSIVRYKSLSFDYLVSSIQKRSDNLAKAVNPQPQGHGVAKAVQALDKSLIMGDLREAYNLIFDDLFDECVEEGWIAEVSPCLRASLKWIETTSLSLACSIFFLCEWATCDFRDCRNAPPSGLKFTGRKDFSQVYLAVQLLKLHMEVSSNLSQGKSDSPLGSGMLTKCASQFDTVSGGTTVEHVTVTKNKLKIPHGGFGARDIFRSPGPVHDILVCWMDQHEIGKGEGFKRLELLLVELIHAGIFFPQAYARQLIVSGIMDRNETQVDLDRWKRHHQILKILPGPYLLDALKEARIAAVPVLQEAMRVYANERRLVLYGLSGDYSELKSSTHTSQRNKDNLVSGWGATSPVSGDRWKNVHSVSASLSDRHAKSKPQVAEVKTAISLALNFPEFCSTFSDAHLEESLGTKRPIGLVVNKTDLMEGTDGCEECRRAKKQKTGDDRSLFQQGCSSNPSDDEDSWWLRKGHKSQESFKVDPPLKPAKHAARNRQKIVRKTQSLAQLASARIEGSQGASTSHVCDNKNSCPHHRSGTEGEHPKSVDGIRTMQHGDIVKIGKVLKQLRLLEKRTITGWLMRSVMQLVEGTEKTVSNLGQSAGSFNLIEERCSVQWKLGEDELSAILYLMDVASDIVSAIRFLLWLLSRLSNDHNSAIYSGRNMLMLSKNAEIYACDVGEAFLLSSIRRYENILISADLLPEVLSATMRRAALVLGSNGRASTSAAFIYARNLLKKYANLSNVIKWEKKFKATCDPRLFTELESGRALDGEFGFSAGIPAGVEDPDGYCRQKIIGRLPRAGPSMKELVQHCFYGKERKLMTAGTPRSSGMEKSDDVHQRAQQIVLALTDCIRQNSGGAQEVDPSLVVSAISAIISNVCLAIAKLPDFTANSSYTKFPSAVSNLNSARRIVHIHTTCLFLLKEALGERYCRVFEIAFATEASLAVAGAFTPGKGSRSQFPEAHDSNANLSNDILNNSTQGALARATKAASAVSALVVGAVVQGVTSLERMVTVFRLKEGLDVVQLIKNARSSSNGMSRSIGTMKVDSSIEVVVHWFRLLIGNPRTVYDGLVVELLGEPCMLALARMQRMLPLSLIFPPAYSIFSLVIWRPYILNGNIVNREDVQVYQSLAMAIDGAIKHQPFRDVCLRDTRALYDNLTSDPADSEFAALLELHGLDKHMKIPFVPLRARHFLNALLDCRMPQSMVTQGNGDAKVLHAENEKKLTDQLVHVLDTLQPAKFHWQWVELRLLLNEQDLIEKVESPTMSLAESIRSLSSSTDNISRSEIGNNFSEMVLTRLLVRPDAAPLYSEVVHLLGKSQEESLLLHAKWFLAGPDVLYGRKSIRQRLTNVAQLRGLSTKVQFWKPWGWSTSDATANKIDKKVEASSLEEGEVVEDGLDFKRLGKMTSQMSDAEGFLSNQQYLTERALAELVLPCMDRSSSDSRTTFASDLIKQMNNIEQQISLLTGSASKQAGAVAIGVESTATKGNSRKGMRGGSPGLGKRSMGAADSAPPSTMALRASMWLRLQFLLRLLPVICSDRDPSFRSMRYMLASVILRLLGTRVLHEDANLSFYAMQSSNSEVELCKGGSVAVSLDNSGESLFDRFLSVLYGLLGGCKPSWLKPKSASKFSVKSPREFAALDGELAEKLQSELDRMELPETIRWRIQAAMPVLARFNPSTISCQPLSLSAAAIASLQSSISAPAIPPGNSNASQRNSIPLPRIASNTTPGKPKTLPLQDQEMEIDPWMVLEDGTGSCPSSSNSNVGVGGETANLKACNWLKGAVRVRRTDLTYIGAVDEDN